MEEYLIFTVLLLVAGGGRIIGVVELRQYHISFRVFLVILLIMDNAAPGNGFFPHDAKFEELAITGFEDVVVMNGEKVGRWGSHVDFVVVWLWRGSY